MEERLEAPWSPLEALPLAVLIVLVSLTASVVVTAVLGGPGGIAPLLAQLAFDVSIVLVTYAWVVVRYPGAWPSVRLRSRRPATDALLGGLSGILVFGVSAFGVLYVVMFAYESLAGRAPPPIRQITFELTPVNLALGVVLVVVAAPVAEELFFRGFLHTSLRSRFGIALSTLVSSLVFGAFHATADEGGVLLVPVLAIVGAAFALLYEWRKSLIVPIAAHATFNAIGYVLIVAERMAT